MKSRTKTFILRGLFILVLVSSSLAATRPNSTVVPRFARPTTIQILEQLGGYPCPYDSMFTCVTVDVPLDHFDPVDTRTIPVTFAVHPALGVRRGMLVVATGGPGTSGIALADSYVSGYNISILRRFDIVFFDQRGVGLSGGLTCPKAALEYYRSDKNTDTSERKEALAAAAGTFSDDCVAEAGSEELLPYLGTTQAIEDLEYFRQLMQDAKFWLYGESYGTQYAQTYAARHHSHLAGLILDGVVDLTLTGFEFYAQQAQAFNDTLQLTLEACNSDPYCIEDVGGNILRRYPNLEPISDNVMDAYDYAVKSLKAAPVRYDFPLPEGGFDERYFQFSDLETVAAGQMYTEADRMMFNRALAASASYGNAAPLARLLHLSLGVDPQTLEVIPDPSYSDAMFYAVECQDYGYPGTTPDEKIINFFNAGDQVLPFIPWLGSVFYGDLPCAFWPHAATDLTRPVPLGAAGIPTLVLNATADPATPFDGAFAVFRRLRNGYLISQRGGPHVIFGWGNPCPDNIVTKFLVHGKVPASRQTRCPGIAVEDYVPIAPTDALGFANLLEALSWTETEFSYLPEYYYWDGYTRTQVGCPLGGTFAFESTDVGVLYTLNACSFASGFQMQGTGSYDPDQDKFILDISTQGRWQCDITYTRRGTKTKVTGNCDGMTVNAQGKVLSPVQDGKSAPDALPDKDR